MSDKNNFLKIRIFNLEQKLKQEAEKQKDFTQKMLKEINVIENKLIEIDRENYPDRKTKLTDLNHYESNVRHAFNEYETLFNYIESLYKGKEEKEEKPKKQRKTKSKKSVK